VDGGWFKVRITTHVKVSNPKIFINVDPQKLTRYVQVRYPFCASPYFTVVKVPVQKSFFSSFLTCTVHHCQTLGPIAATFLFSFLETFYCHCGNRVPKLSLPFYDLPCL
jgi:hypothetical protein